MKKKLSKIDIIALVVGSIIGWGSFSLPGTKFLRESGIIGTAIGFLIGGLSVIFIQAGYHIMMERHSKDGGEFSYAYEHLGRKHGFIVGWSLVLCYLSMIPLNATALVLVLKQLFGQAISYGYLYTIAGYPVYLSEILIASAVILLFSSINKKGIQVSSFVQNTMVLLLVINVIVIFVIMLFKGNLPQFQATYVSNYVFSWKEVLPVVAIIPFLFVGFDVVPQVATDLGFSSSKATYFTVGSIGIGTLLYILLNTITGLVYTPDQAGQLNWATGDAVLEKIGVFGFVLLILALIGAVTGGINGFFISSSKIVASLSEHHLLPQKYQSKTAEGVLANAIQFVTIVTLIAPWLGREVILYIVDMSSALAALVYGYVCFISLRYAENKRSWAMCLVGLLMALLFLVLLLAPFSISRLSTMSLILMLAWAVVGYFYYRHHTK
ncbi:MAG: APC family permease [Aerococcaceae bacterium]|nr:APC family permease [Aerococcaceae bacterium]